MTRDEALAFADLRAHDCDMHESAGSVSVRKNDHDASLIVLAHELRQLLVDAGPPNRVLEARVIEQTRWIAKLDDENAYLQKQNKQLAQWVDNLHAELSDAIARLGGESYAVVNRTRDEILAELESQRIGRIPSESELETARKRLVAILEQEIARKDRLAQDVEPLREQIVRLRAELMLALHSLAKPPEPSLKDKYKSIGFAVGVIPFSWGFGPWVRPHKIAVALGPFRLFIYRSLKDWKSYDGAPRH